MAIEDGTILRDGEKELNVTLPADLEMPNGTGRESAPMGAGDDPLGDVVSGDPGVEDEGDEQEPDGTDGTDGGGV